LQPLFGFGVSTIFVCGGDRSIVKDENGDDDEHSENTEVEEEEGL
jgi:hypothetical protein